MSRLRCAARPAPWHRASARPGRHRLQPRRRRGLRGQGRPAARRGPGGARLRGRRPAGRPRRRPGRGGAARGRRRRRTTSSSPPAAPASRPPTAPRRPPARVLDHEIPGIPEAIRAVGREKVPTAALSRGLAGSRAATLIVNLPGSTGGVRTGSPSWTGCCRTPSTRSAAATTPDPVTGARAERPLAGGPGGRRRRPPPDKAARPAGLARGQPAQPRLAAPLGGDHSAARARRPDRAPPDVPPDGPPSAGGGATRAGCCRSSSSTRAGWSGS